jgi:hypothetical protein
MTVNRKSCSLSSGTRQTWPVEQEEGELHREEAESGILVSGDMMGIGSRQWLALERGSVGWPSGTKQESWISGGADGVLVILQHDVG